MIPPLTRRQPKPCSRRRAKSSAEQATGYYWGEPALREDVRRIMARAQKSGDDRLEQLARRFLR
jgi:hypothetical protein